jgi:hypothetical protein
MSSCENGKCSADGKTDICCGACPNINKCQFVCWNGPVARSKDYCKCEDYIENNPESPKEDAIMRSLEEILDSLKANEKPNYEELRYSALCLAWLLNFEHVNLAQVLSHKKDFTDSVKKSMLKESIRRYKDALKSDPKKYLGWNQDPENPNYQAFLITEKKLRSNDIINKAEDIPALNKIIKNELKK